MDCGKESDDGGGDRRESHGVRMRVGYVLFDNERGGGLQIGLGQEVMMRARWESWWSDLITRVIRVGEKTSTARGVE